MGEEPGFRVERAEVGGWEFTLREGFGLACPIRIGTAFSVS